VSEDWATVEGNELLTKDFKLNRDLSLRLIAWGLNRGNPIGEHAAVGKNAHVVLGCLAGIVVEPKAGG
jgi:hypothetical protein